MNTQPFGQTNQMIDLCCEYLYARCIWLYVIIMSNINIQTNIECGFTLKWARDMTRTYSQMHRPYKHSEHNSIIWSVWPNGWAFIYKLSGCGLESRYSHLIFKYGACFKQGVLWHWGKYKVWIHCEMRTWHDNNKQSNAPYI